MKKIRILAGITCVAGLILLIFVFLSQFTLYRGFDPKLLARINPQKIVDALENQTLDGYVFDGVLFEGDKAYWRKVGFENGQYLACQLYSGHYAGYPKLKTSSSFLYDTSLHAYYLILDLNSNVLEARFTSRSNSRSPLMIEEELARIIRTVGE